jgi:hypothetical protein
VEEGGERGEEQCPPRRAKPSVRGPPALARTLSRSLKKKRTGARRTAQQTADGNAMPAPPPHPPANGHSAAHAPVTLDGTSAPPPPPPPPPSKAAVRRARRRGINAGLHYSLCGGRIAIGERERRGGVYVCGLSPDRGGGA